MARPRKPICDTGVLFEDLEELAAPPPAAAPVIDADEQAWQRAAAAASVATDQGLAHPEDPWAASPHRWLKNLAPASRSKAAVRFAELLVCGAGYAVEERTGPGHDRVVAGRRVTVKMSTLWTNGTYSFQKLRRRQADTVMLLGVSPAHVHAWWVPVDVLFTNVGADGGDDDGAWLIVDPVQPPEWLGAYGGPMRTWAEAVASDCGAGFAPHGPAIPR